MRLQAERRQLAESDLVQDLPRILVLEVVLLRPLQRGERGESPLRQLGPHPDGLQRRDQGVPPEDGHEPRQARRRQRVLVSPDVRVQPQGGQVDDGALVDVREEVPAG